MVLVHSVVSLVLANLALTASAQYYNNAGMTGLGCVVSGRKLFSHGNYIRDLNEEEVAQVTSYKKELADFQKGIGEAYAKSDISNDPNATLPVIPPRPVVPSFCTTNETTLYIIGSCSVQNHKIYVNGKFARELDEEEKAKLAEFAARLAQASQPAIPSTDNSTDTTTSTTPPPLPTLDFCTEF